MIYWMFWSKELLSTQIETKNQYTVIANISITLNFRISPHSNQRGRCWAQSILVSDEADENFSYVSI